jgi:hypothetical protein
MQEIRNSFVSLVIPVMSIPEFDQPGYDIIKVVGHASQLHRLLISPLSNPDYLLSYKKQKPGI